ncbi:single-stranded-DNA-specific exonuclease RecJ [Roseospirillum parvum]|uniref:Single-stranded-DNA-specific exonuclease RecJ n=1 Tax=Roseospirillum parvum TaxID=83401 RepID=A0A1G8ASB9_9PROT|nr:single-stranded-DNA-specific exonuclease RecJ [Roseospirillum parvum]SDH23962.1 single-stranded-DNA-specific exonuclease [Roseospirillum parvum]
MTLPQANHSFLGVERSIGGRRWVLRPADDGLGVALAQAHALPEVVGRLMAARGVALEAAEDFLSPTLRRLLPDPEALADMNAAAQRLAEAVSGGETIAIFGDYDVDGATSAALLHRFFRQLGATVLVHIPDRRAEGYGPNLAAFQELQAKGASLVVTVDCGITAFEPLAGAARAGLDVVVCDHHQAETRLPEARAVVNPKRPDDTSGLEHLAAVGVAFLLAVAVNRALRDAGHYANGRAEPDLKALLDLVALGTVCDMVPLVGLNRALVTQGLKVMARRDNVGLAALADVCRLDRPPEAFHLGYVMGPRVNAGGRVGQADLGARLLASEDPAEARAIAEQLNELNGLRQEVEAAVLKAAIEQVESRPHGDSPLLFALGRDWHPGVVGIVAGRLRERYDLPAIVATDEGGMVKGSGRGVPGLDLGGAVIAAREAGLLVNGGGHAMAAGFTVEADRLAAFQAFLDARLAEQLAACDLVPTLELDGAVDAAGASWTLIETLARVGPFGIGNPEPRFVLPDCRIARVDVVGQGHVRCFIEGPRGGRLKAIAFKAADSDVGVRLLASAQASLHLAGTLRPDTYNGRQDVQLVIDDAAEAG